MEMKYKTCSKCGEKFREVESMKFEDLQKQVLEWADKKDLLHEENKNKQFMKFIEEVFEFKTELDYVNIVNEDEDYTEEFKNFCRNSLQLEFGDVLVTLIILAKQLDLNLTQCLEKAYKKIKYRTGKTINGTFVKSEEL